MPTLEIHLHGVTLMSSPMNCFLILSIVACGLLVEGLVTENLTFVNITSDSAIVLWKSPFGDASGSTSSMIIRKIFRKSRIANYTIQSCWTNDSEVLPHSRLGTYYYLTSLQQNTTYCYFSKYTTRNGTVQNYSSCRCFKTDPGAPSKPASFQVSRTTSRAVSVSWSECVGATAYYLGFKRASPGEGWTTVELGSTTTSHTIQNLQPSTTYSFRVQCETAGGHSAYRTDLITTPSDPVPSRPMTVSTKSIVTGSLRTVSLAWTCSDASKYYVQYWRDGLDNFPTLVVSTPSVNISGLQSSTLYTFELFCENTYGKNNSTLVHHTTLAVPYKPASFTFSQTTTRAVSVSWSECVGATAYYLGFKSAHSGEGWTTLELGSTTTSHTIQNLQPSTNYSLRVQCETAGGHSAYRTYLISTSSDPVPSRPKSVSTKSTARTVSLAWTCSDASKYYVQYWRDGYDSDNFPTLVVSTLPVNISGLQSSTSYTFKLFCENTYGKNSSTLVHHNTLAEPEEVHCFVIVEETVSSLAVSWAALRGNIDIYKLTIQPMASDSPSIGEVSLVSSAEMYTFRNLLPSTEYHISIWAVNKAGEGPTSVLNATTEPDFVAGKPSGPSSWGVGSTVVAVVFGAIVFLFIVVASVLIIKRKRSSVGKYVMKNSTESIPMEENVAYDSINHCTAVFAGQTYNKNCKDDAIEHEDGIKDGSDNDGDSDSDSTLTLGAAEAKSYLKCLTLPPRIPARDYIDKTESKPTIFTTFQLPAWPDFEEFKNRSGWFKPTVAHVLRKKLGYKEDDFSKLGPGIFYMYHKSKKKAKYVTYSLDLSKTLCVMISNLYEKERCDLNPLEVELKYYSPSANKWCIRVWRCEKKALLLERAKRIIEYQTLRPHGLNKELKISSREVLNRLSEWYVNSMKRMK